MAARRVTGNSVPSEVEKYRVLQEENEMKLKKQVVLGMTAAVAAAVTGCSSSGDTATNAAAEVTTAAETGETTAEETEAETETEAAETEAAGEEEAENEENYDTGDASLDNSRNQDEIGESELLVASFGTSYNDNRRLTIGAIEEAMEAAFPDYSVRRGFTSQIIIDHVKDRDGEVIDNMTEAFNRAIDNGVKILVIQPTHLMDGLEYSDVVNEAAEFSDSFEKIAIGRPLLDTDADFEAVIKAITEATAEYDDGETAICFMGHGTEAESNQVYGKMQDMLTAAGYENYFVGTVEAEPGLEDMLAAVGEGSYKKAVLLPLMIVAGDHANNDMAGDDEGTWKTEFEAAGYEVTCMLNGLGELEAIQQLFVEHARAAMDSLAE
jgi:sirohydrochlorin cobaltochelatase